jgi:hypothetical protein
VAETSVDVLHPETLEALVTEKPRKIAELAATLNVSTTQIKAGIAANPRLKAKQGGWVGLADTE